MRSLLTAALLALAPLLLAQDDAAPAAGGGAKDSPEAALKNFAVAPGLRVEVWAAEPLVTNPVAFAFDEKGRAFVAETFRRRSSALDIRKNTDWLADVLSHRSVEDRVGFLKKALSEPKNAAKRIKDLNADGVSDWRDLEVESERVRLVEDADGDGKADRASVFAEDFKTVATGVGAGVLAHGGEIFYACLPDLWRLRDAKGAGVADSRDKLLSGFGVHVAYSGHDMHGVKIGPDGKIYWTIADTGARVTSREGKVIAVPDSGAVFRANLDGTELELVMSGLRNPQSLAFNDVGDLFTGDNNADGGDAARWVHVVEGGDAGWRIGWQFLPKLGAWNAEKLWELDTGATALSQLPPVGHVGHGPAGIAYYPGTGLPDAYRDHFFYADFPGGVRSFALKAKGASYELANPGPALMDNTPQQMTGKLLWNLFPSDVQFGVDGGVYVLDWVQGWEKTGKGRIFRVHDPAVDQSAIVLETKALLARLGKASIAASRDLAAKDAAGAKAQPSAPDTGAPFSADELVALLGHADQRVRLAAQFELAARGEVAGLALIGAAITHPERLGRVHAVWAIGQIARHSPALLIGSGAGFLAGPDPEVRAQAAKILGDAGIEVYADQLVKALRDPEPRVRFFAAQSLGKIKARSAVEPLFAMLHENADRDANLRHAGVVALANCAGVERLAAKTADPSPAVRAAAVLALRRLGSAEVAKFLTDENRQVALEAARAIYDTPIDSALPQLAALANGPWVSAPFTRRAIQANYRFGTADAARRLAIIAAQRGMPDGRQRETDRLEAIEALAQWNEQPLGRDRLLGVHRPLAAGRDAAAAAKAAADVFSQILENSPEPARIAALDMAASLHLAQSEGAIAAVALDGKARGPVRAAALRALASFQSPKLAAAVDSALASTDKTLLAEARRFVALVSPARAVEQAAAVLESGSVAEKQSALRTLSTLAVPEADALLAEWLARLLAGQAPAAIQLDLLEAAALRTDAAVKQQLAAYETARTAADPLARWRECLEGGDAKAGRELFFEKAEAACLRCHKIKGEGGDVGPDLAGIGAKQDRAHLLASIVDPSAVIAPGYENVMLTLRDGSIVAGIVSAQTVEELTLTQLADGAKLKVRAADVAQRDAVPSAMPPGLGEVLGKRGLRDVIEYLATLK